MSNDKDKEKKDPGKDPGTKKAKDAKPKKEFNAFAYYLAWLGFVSIVGSALFKLIKSMEYPEKNEYYK